MAGHGRSSWAGRAARGAYLRVGETLQSSTLRDAREREAGTGGDGCELFVHSVCGFS